MSNPNSTNKCALLTRECENAEAIFRKIVQYDAGNRDVLNLDESPLKPWIVDQASILLLYRLHKSNFFYGSMTGSGIAVARLRTSHPSLIKWSAPLFLKLSARSGGISFGSQSIETFAVSTTHDAITRFSIGNGQTVRGFEFSVCCGPQMRERADILAANFTPTIPGCLGVSKVTGTVFDISIVSGTLAVDTVKCAVAYGENTTAQDILSGKVPSPPEFNPLYGEFSRIVHAVDRPSVNPARMSASLERFSTGRDPERLMVLPDGVIIREDLKEPPKEL